VKKLSKKGRGSLITFMSKNFINNNIIISIGAAIQGTIVKEIKECIKFSIMIDSTLLHSGCKYYVSGIFSTVLCKNNY